MITEKEQRFHELAHKALARRINPAERQELTALMEAEPTLRAEFERMGPEGADVMQALLPIMESLRSPAVSSPPIQRLRRAVGTERQRPALAAEVSGLLERLEAWATTHGAPHVMPLLVNLRRALMQGSMPKMKQAAEWPTQSEGVFFERHYALMSTLSDPAASRDTPETLIRRLHEMEQRLAIFEQQAGECRKEIRELTRAVEIHLSGKPPK